MTVRRAWSDVDPEIPGSFWLVGDDRLEHSLDRQKARLLYAYFVHSLLYNRKLVISDSIAVNNPNLRYLLRNDRRVREMINVDTFCVARRLVASGKMVHLLELRDEFIKGNKQNPAFEGREFHSDEELEFLQVQASSAKYSLEAVSTHYTQSTLSLLKSDQAVRRFTAPLRDKVIGLAEDSMGGGGKLLRSFFYGGLEHAVTSQEWSQFGEQLRQFGNAFYFSALPNVLDAQPVFPQAYEAEWSILRGFRAETTSEPASGAIDWETELPVSGYVEGLNRLEPGDVFALRDPAGEFGAFHDALSKRAHDQSETAEEVQRRLFLYERKIVARILEKFPEARSSAGPRLSVSARVYDLLELSKASLVGAGLALMPELGRMIGVNVEVAYAGLHVFGVAAGLAAVGFAADGAQHLLRHSVEDHKADLDAEGALQEMRLRKLFENDASADKVLRVEGRAVLRGTGDQIYRRPR